MRSYSGANYTTWALGGNLTRPCVMACKVSVTTGSAKSQILHAHSAVGANYFSLYWGNDAKFHAEMVQGATTIAAAHTSTSTTGEHSVFGLFSDGGGAGGAYVVIAVDGVIGNSAFGTESGLGTLARLNVAAFKGGAIQLLSGNVGEIGIWTSVSGSTTEPFFAEGVSAYHKGVPVSDLPVMGTLNFWARLMNSASKDLVNGASPTDTGGPGTAVHTRQLNRFLRRAA